MQFFWSLGISALRGCVRHPLWVLALAISISALGGYFGANLRVNTDLAQLLPPEYPSVQALEKLRATVGGESAASVVIESPSFEANRQFAETLIPQVLATRGAGATEPYFTRVEYRKETDFLKDHALYFAAESELDQLETFLTDKIEEAKLEANPFYFSLDDEEDEEDAITEDDLRAIYDRVIPKEFPISDDSTTMVLRFFASGSQANVGFIGEAYAALDETIATLNPTTFHPAMTVETGGRLSRQRIEVQAITDDLQNSLGLGIGAVLLLVVSYFFYKAIQTRGQAKVWLAELARLPITALLLGLPLAMSLLWTFGIAGLTLGTLNLMTATLGLVLFGLGIDYGIHFYARYTEERAAGKDVPQALETTFNSTGQAIAVSALTTALALYVLMVADFRGFSEFGLIAGTGIILALLATLFVLPALIVVFERIRMLNLTRLVPLAAPSTAATRYPFARGWIVISVLAVGLAVVFLPKIEFEYRFAELEPTFEDYRAFRAKEARVYAAGDRRNPAYIVVDHGDEIPPLVAQLTTLAAADTTSPTILAIESLQERFPLDPARQHARLGRIADIRDLLADPFLEDEDSEDLQRLRRASQTTAPIPLAQVPDFLRTRFTDKNGELGQFVMIYPSVGLSDGRQSMAFAEDIGQVDVGGQTYHAGSTSLVAADMLRLLQRESPWMILLTFLMIAGIMGLTFRSVRWAMLALVPLVVGVLWMLGLMELVGVRLNFYNMIVLPAVLGIGNDCGVHLVHRYREEGPGSVRRVLRSSGEHITIGSLTTMVGFAGLLFSFHPGLQSMGLLAVLGIGATLLAALLFLPALLSVLSNKRA